MNFCRLVALLRCGQLHSFQTSKLFNQKVWGAKIDPIQRRVNWVKSLESFGMESSEQRETFKGRRVRRWISWNLMDSHGNCISLKWFPTILLVVPREQEDQRERVTLNSESSTLSANKRAHWELRWELSNPPKDCLRWRVLKNRFHPIHPVNSLVAGCWTRKLLTELSYRGASWGLDALRRTNLSDCFSVGSRLVGRRECRRKRWPIRKMN